MNSIKILGLVAATLTTISFLPQVVQSWKTKDVKGISLPMYTIFTFGVFLWLMYGLFVKDLPVILANSFIFIFASLILILKIKYR
ncbi:MAG: SemiSWEET transporter [Patescibacteria group bacterium]|nr:SemiSWEET transporter [Patescibacteria group bacterium]